MKLLHFHDYIAEYVLSLCTCTLHPLSYSERPIKARVSNKYLYVLHKRVYLHATDKGGALLSIIRALQY